jgi:hypothetical protein
MRDIVVLLYFVARIRPGDGQADPVHHDHVGQIQSRLGQNLIEYWNLLRISHRAWLRIYGRFTVEVFAIEFINRDDTQPSDASWAL